MNKYYLTGLSVAGGILSGLAWTGWCSGLILLVAFVPYFLIEQFLFENPRRHSPNSYFIYLLPGMTIFSILTLGWMHVASLTGAICVIMGLAFLMSFALWLAHMVRIRAGNTAGIIAMFSFWLLYEFISLNVNLVSPWINLGNGLAKDILFIQWYEVTGTAGGTLWILGSNILLATYILLWLYGKKRNRMFLFLWLLVIIVPSLFSVYRYETVTPSDNKPSEVVIVQPNTDPYTEKYTVPFTNQLRKVITLAETEVTDKTGWIVCPETTIDDPVNLDKLADNKYTGMVRESVKQYPSVNVIMGMVTYKMYPPTSRPPTVSARKTDGSGSYSDHYNSAILADSSKNAQVYHKSKLVPGIEMQFSNGPGRLIAAILPDLGGTKWGFGTQNERTCFTHTKNNIKIAPIICYESVFGEFVTGYVRNGAEALFIITNDGWWKNTSGYKQHLSFASVRAIETRRPVIRSANTGVSCLIDIKGKRTSEIKWWTEAVLKGSFIPETSMTIYARYGDWLLYIAVITAIILFVTVFIYRPLIKKISLKK